MEIMGKWKGLLYSFKVCKRLYECYWNDIKEVKKNATAIINLLTVRETNGIDRLF